MAILKQLPSPPQGKIGFPWTEETPPPYFTENLPKISIITPSFNQGQFIEETIRSVLLQGYPNLEYIIIDGGSTDQTLEIIQKYNDFITYWVSEKDKGQSDAINKGLKKATGEVFNWLNSDDYYLPNALITVAEAFKNTEMNIFCAQQYTETNDGKRTHFKGVTYKKTLEETLVSPYFSQSPTFFRLPIVKELGGLESNLFFCMDLELWLNYLTHFGHKDIFESDAFLAVFRIHPDTKTSNAKKINYSDCFNLLMALVRSSEDAANFPSHFLKDNSIFSIYFIKQYPLNGLVLRGEKFEEKRLLLLIAQQLVSFYSQYMGWQGFFELYFYVFRQLPLVRNWRFYLSPLIKIKRIVWPIL